MQVFDKAFAELDDQSDSTCIELADALYAGWCLYGKFPIFWELIGYEQNKLRAIFSFFCEMEELNQGDEPQIIRDELERRLNSRISGIALEFPSSGLKDQVEEFSKRQLAAFEQLESERLTNVGFELFVTGSLTVKNRQFLEKGRFNLEQEFAPPFRLPEPDSGNFFYWAEFAFLASYFGFDSEKWAKILPVLLRAERIYALCYGEPHYGRIPADRKREDYRTTISLEFNNIHPYQSQNIPLPLATRFDELEAEATACAKFAFPGEDWR